MPKGSVLEPTSWDILYDGALRLDLGTQVEQFAFVDKLALIIEASDKKDLVPNANEALIKVND